MAIDKFDHAEVVTPFGYETYKREGRDMRRYIKNRLIQTSGTAAYSVVAGDRRVFDWLGNEHRPLPCLIVRS